MKTSENQKIQPLRISTPSPKYQKYLYTKILAYTVPTSHSISQKWPYVVLKRDDFT